MQSEESNTLVKLAKAVIEHAPEGSDAFWDIKFSDIEAALSAAEPVKTPFEIASKHIPEARVSLLSRAIRQGLNDYGWKNFGTLPEVLMGYIVQAEKAEADAHPQKPRDCGHDGGDLSERRDNIGSAYTRSALSAKVQDVADMPQSPWPASDWAIGRIKELEAQAVPEGWQLVPKEPTQEMCDAAPSLPAIHAIDDLPFKKSGWSMSAIVNRKRYLAMLAAAPAKQEGGE